jgi:acyl carrier protein
MIKEQIKKIMTEVFEIESSLVNDDISQNNTGQWDSLNHLNLIVEIEEELDVSFTPEQIGSMTSLEIILDEIKKTNL